MYVACMYFVATWNGCTFCPSIVLKKQQPLPVLCGCCEMKAKYFHALAVSTLNCKTYAQTFANNVLRIMHHIIIINPFIITERFSTEE